jgi:site-specific DNA-cytosine methylase
MTTDAPASISSLKSASQPADQMLELFGGIGGFAHALTNPEFGFHVPVVVELDADAQHSYLAAFPAHRRENVVGNIRTLTLRHDDGRIPTDDDVVRWERQRDHGALTAVSLRPATDPEIAEALAFAGADAALVAMIAGGFPCQPFSKGGPQAGVRDLVRGTLFGDVMRLVDVCRPATVLLENVPNLAGAKHRDWFNTILESLRSAGYSISSEPVLLSPHTLAPELGGQPQVRKRLFFLASLGPAEITMDDLTSTFTWDPAAWDAQDLCDPDASFDTRPYLLAPRETVWLDAWHALVQALPGDDLPGVLFVDTFDPAWVLAPGTHPAAAAKMSNSHTFYLANRRVIDTWTARTWDLEGQPVGARDFPPSRRILEWQARSAQPTAASRSLWDCAIQLRPSGVRVKPLTTLPALVAINQTSIIGPRARKITPREAARLQGMPVGVWTPVVNNPDGPAPDLGPALGDDALVARRALAPRVALLGGPLIVRRTDPSALARAAQAVADAWWARGGHCPEAIAAALEGADQSGAGGGEILLAAAALATREPRWRGSAVRWSELAWDTYTRLVSCADPLAFDPSLAAIDVRVRYRMAVEMARVAATSRGEETWLPAPEAAAWFWSHTTVALPTADTGGWAGRARDIARAATSHHIPVFWLRALHRSALLARWDQTDFPLDGLSELDKVLADLGILDVQEYPAGAPTLTQMYALVTGEQTRTATALGVPAHGVGARYAGTGAALLPAPLTGAHLTAGLGRLDEAEVRWRAGAARVAALAAAGTRDPRTEQSVLDGRHDYLAAAVSLRRHRTARTALLRAARSAGPVLGRQFAAGALNRESIDLALAALEHWGRFLVTSPHGPPALLADPDLTPVQAHANLNAAIAADARPCAGPHESTERSLRLWDARLLASPRPASTRSVVMRAHYERRRELLAHLLGLVDAGSLGTDELDEAVFALTGRSGLAALCADLELTVGFCLDEDAPHATTAIAA